MTTLSQEELAAFFNLVADAIKADHMHVPTDDYVNTIIEWLRVNAPESYRKIFPN